MAPPTPSLPQTCPTVWSVTATDMSHGVVSHCHRHVPRCGQSLPQTCLTVWSVTATDMSHGVVSHCHRHVSRCGQSLPQTCLTVWSLPQTCLTVWSVTATDISHGVVTATDCMSHGVVSHCSHSSSVGSSVRPPRLSLPLTDWLFSLVSRLSSKTELHTVNLASFLSP